MKLLTLYLLFSFLTFVSCKNKEALSTEKIAKLDSISKLDVPKQAPGIATGIVMNGEIVYKKYEGYAHLKDSVLINDQSRFNIASNGKQFTALAILNLIDEDKLSLEDDLRTYFPNLYKEIETPILIKHLLNHSSGIRDIYDLWSLQGITWWKQTYNNEEAIAFLEKQNDLNFNPGSQYLYSNSNYILLAEVIAKVSGQSFIEYTNDMFKLLNMPNTSFENDYKNIKGPVAQPYFNFDTWSNYSWVWNIHGDGNIFSTLPDQLKWEKIVQTKKSDAFSENLLIQSQSIITNSNIDNYGYGIEFGTHRKRPYSFHAGATGAWKAFTARFVDDNFSIVTMTNSGKTLPSMQTLLMADVILEKSSEDKSFITEPEKTGNFISIKDVLGIYQTIGGYIMEFVERDGELFMLRSGRNDMKLIRESDNVFQKWNDAPFKQEFTKNESGVMQITAYYTTVPPFTLTRIESDFSEFDYKSLNGNFLNSETDVEFIIEHQENEIYEVTVRNKKIKGLLITPTELLVNDYRLRVLRDTIEKKDELFLTSGRIKEVRFTRMK